MTAPGAPTIHARQGPGSDGYRAAYLRWLPVATAATYNVYVGATNVATVSSVGPDGWFSYVIKPNDLGLDPVTVTVTAVNAGSEESAASNGILLSETANDVLHFDTTTALDHNRGNLNR